MKDFILYFILLGIGIWFISYKVRQRKIKRKNEVLLAQTLELESRLEQLKSDEQQQIGKLLGIKENLKATEEQAKEAAEQYYSSNLELAKQKLDISLQEAERAYQSSVEQFKRNYQLAVDNTAKAKEELKIKLDKLQSSVEAAVEAAKRAEELKSKQDFFRIQLSDIDIEEIKKLRSIESYLRNKEPLNKVIWKVYYEKPTNDLIGRVISLQTSPCGIYKITHIESQKCYVGQSRDISTRWKQHIKRGLGADTPTRNKLYPAMKEFGPENFTFEVLELCSPEDLNDKEKFWTDYFHAQEYGYSIRKG